MAEFRQGQIHLYCRRSRLTLKAAHGVFSIRFATEGNCGAWHRCAEHSKGIAWQRLEEKRMAKERQSLARKGSGIELP